MPRKAVFLLLASLFLIFAVTALASRDQSRPVRLNDYRIEQLSAVPHFASAEACTVKHAADPYWLIDHWVTGNELYKSYQDPGLSCVAPYPFSVEAVHMYLWFDNPCTLYASVDVETVDLSEPTCPAPGDLLSISSEYMFLIPEQGLWHIAIPLDSVAEVNGPYFAGFFIANAIDSAIGAAVVTDNFPATCTDYNIWDEEVGFIDLGNNAYYNFDGKLELFSSGTTGGSGGDPLPEVTLLTPRNNEIVAGDLACWALESSGSTIIDSVVFYYKAGGDWTRIAADGDGSSPLRNGLDEAGDGDGYYSPFNYSGVSEGLVSFRALAFDTLGRIGGDSNQVTIDPTPPDPSWVTPESMDTICLPLTLEAATVDENVSNMRFMKKAAPLDYALAVTLLHQINYGDADGDPADGNPVSGGEFGDYYCGPVAGAMAVKYWYDQGYTLAMKEGLNYISVDTAVERMAVVMKTREMSGTYDDCFFDGLHQYNQDHGQQLVIKSIRKPGYDRIRQYFQEQELFVIMGVGGLPGLYLPLTGLSGLADVSGEYALTIADPINGVEVASRLRPAADGLEAYYNGTWHSLDIIFTVAGNAHAPSRDLISIVYSSPSGWTYDWMSSDMIEDSLYYLTVQAVDLSGRLGLETGLIRHDCTPPPVKADYDGNGTAETADIIVLLNYVFKKDGPPAGGGHRADANCDGNIDISDVIFVINYFYSGGEEPCY